MRRCIGSAAAICQTTPPTRFRRDNSSDRPASSISRWSASRTNDYLLDVGALERWESRHGRIPRGAWVCSRSGWSRRSGDGFHNLRDDGPHTPDSIRPRHCCWRRIATCSASASRRSARMRDRQAGSIRRSRTTTSCTATASWGWRACATSIACPPRARADRRAAQARERQRQSGSRHRARSRAERLKCRLRQLAQHLRNGIWIKPMLDRQDSVGQRRGGIAGKDRHALSASRSAPHRGPCSRNEQWRRCPSRRRPAPVAADAGPGYFGKSDG